MLVVDLARPPNGAPSLRGILPMLSRMSHLDAQLEPYHCRHLVSEFPTRRQGRLLSRLVCLSDHISAVSSSHST